MVGVTGPRAHAAERACSSSVSHASSAALRGGREQRADGAGRSLGQGGSPMPRNRTRRPRERLIQIGEDVVDVLDADAQADAARADAGRQLFGRRHLAMSGGGRMAGERFRIAQIDQALEELERVVEADARGQAAADVEGQE